MATSLYYFWTLNPDYQNLEFPTSALSSALQLMRSESSEKGVELANSILCYVNDDRMRLEENSNIAQ
ncbi:unnamed protein product [Cylicostephanus goldi]|uniref:Uncharacterized protein n=1 Tax=Cylicostephanus goldi TaxID=71465 RepID=A0A3P6RX73_CYLGO|nr:unnamed protein product [Cylicostephanus goldi]